MTRHKRYAFDCLLRETKAGLYGRIDLSVAMTAARYMKQNRKLQEIELSSVVMDEDVATVLGEALMRAKALKVVAITAGQGAGVAVLLGHLPASLTALDLTGTKLDEAATQAFVSALGRFANLNQLSCHPYVLSDAVADAIVAAPLERLLVQGDSSGWNDTGLLGVIVRCKTITFLSLALPAFPEGFLGRLVEALQSCGILDSLELRLRTEMASMLPRIFALPRLKHLDVGRLCEENVGVVAQGLRSNQSLISFRAYNMSGETLVDAVARNGMLLKVDLDLSDPHQAVLDSYLERNRAMHDRARRAALELVAIRKFVKSELSRHPREIVLMIAKMVWETRADFAWDMPEKKAPMQRAKKESEC